MNSDAWPFSTRENTRPDLVATADTELLLAALMPATL
jgi:hypothetical protein